MRRDELGDLLALLAVAEARSFTRAAAKLGTSQSALSHTIRRLEARLGLRLLSRTTRSVAPTEAGERLIATLRPAFDEIDAKIATLSELREKPAGLVRITTGEHAARTLLWPVLARILPHYPEVKVEVDVNHGLRDIVAERFDAGIRLGEQVAKDMIAVRIGPDLRMLVVGAPAYFGRHPAPRTPHDLTTHACVNIRLPTAGGLYAWEFEKDGHELKVRVDGQLVFGGSSLPIDAALEGLGLAYLMQDMVQPYIDRGLLTPVLEDWSPPFSGYHLYFPSSRQPAPAFALVVEALRYRGPGRDT
jgi:DNA-binding transcriptional LysR family regulator